MCLCRNCLTVQHRSDGHKIRDTISAISTKQEMPRWPPPQINPIELRKNRGEQQKPGIPLASPPLFGRYRNCSNLTGNLSSVCPAAATATG
jgi:hypothetical protein